MASNANRADGTRRIQVQCSCGKRLIASPQQAGKRVKCPECGQPILVSLIEVPPQKPILTQTDEQPESGNQNHFTILWLLSGLFVVGGILFVSWYSYSLHQSKITAANLRISKAAAAAKEWLDKNSASDSEAMISELAEALKDPIATRKADGDSLLGQIQQRREQQVAIARAERTKQEAAAILNDAKQKIEANQISEGLDLLRKYFTDPSRGENTEVRELLAEVENATSDKMVLDSLATLSDKDFEQAKATGEIRDGKVSHPTLVAARKESVLRVREKAAQRRESERLAAIKRQQQEEKERQAEKKRRDAEFDAKMGELRNAPKVSFKDLTNFPEEYVGKRVKIESVWFHGDLERERDLGIFTVGVSSRDGKFVSNTLRKGELRFVVSGEFGRLLDVEFAANKQVATNLYCEIAKQNDYFFGRIYRIETLTVSGNIGKAFEDESVVGEGGGDKGPIIFLGKGTKAEPAKVLIKDLINFPEDFTDKFVRIESVWLHGGFRREKEAALFSVGVSSRDGKYVTSVFTSDSLNFVFSESFGRDLSVQFHDDEKVGTNLYCEITKINNKPIAKIYRVETLNVAGDVLKTYEDK